MASASAVTRIEVKVLANTVQGGRRTVVCGINPAQASKFIKREASLRHLTVNGFRPAQAPIGIVYKAHRKLIDRCLINELRRTAPKSLNKALQNCVTIPEYEVLPWNGRDALKIEVRAHENPAAPNPGGRFGGMADANHDHDILKPGLTQASDGLIPAEVARQMASHGVGLGSTLASQHNPAAGALAEAAPLLGENIPQQVRGVLAERLNSRGGHQAPGHFDSETDNNAGRLRPDKDAPVPLAERKSGDTAMVEEVSKE